MCFLLRAASLWSAGWRALGRMVQSCAVLLHLLSVSPGRWDFLMSLWLQLSRTCTERGGGLCCCACWFKDYPGFIIDTSELCSEEVLMTFGCLPRVYVHVHKPTRHPTDTLVKVWFKFPFLWLTQFYTETFLPRRTKASVVSASVPKWQMFISTKLHFCITN